MAIKHKYLGTYWYTSKLGTGSNFAHDETLDAFQSKRGDNGAAGFSGGLTYSETNWPGEFPADFEAVGVGFELVPAGADAGASTAVADAHDLAQNVNALVKTGEGEIPLGPIGKWPPGEGAVKIGSHAGSTATSNTLNFESMKIMRFERPYMFRKGDKPTIEFHPGNTNVNPTVEFKLRTILIGRHPNV